MTGNSFSTGVAAIRDRAREKMDRGPVTETYRTDPDLLGSHVDKS